MISFLISPATRTFTHSKLFSSLQKDQEITRLSAAWINEDFLFFRSLQQRTSFSHQQRALILRHFNCSIARRTAKRQSSQFLSASSPLHSQRHVAVKLRQRSRQRHLSPVVSIFSYCWGPSWHTSCLWQIWVKGAEFSLTFSSPRSACRSFGRPQDSPLSIEFVHR